MYLFSPPCKDNSQDPYRTEHVARINSSIRRVLADLSYIDEEKIIHRSTFRNKSESTP